MTTLDTATIGLLLAVMLLIAWLWGKVITLRRERDLLRYWTDYSLDGWSRANATNEQMLKRLEEERERAEAAIMTVETYRMQRNRAQSALFALRLEHAADDREIEY